MSGLIVQIAQVLHPDTESFATRKLGQILAGSDADPVPMPAGEPVAEPLALAPLNRTAGFADAEPDRVAQVIEAMFAEVRAGFPLLDGEKEQPLGQGVYVLTGPGGDAESNSLVLERSTNYMVQQVILPVPPEALFDGDEDRCLAPFRTNGAPPMPPEPAPEAPVGMALSGDFEKAERMRLTHGAIDQLALDDVPTDVLDKLRTMVGQEFTEKDAFLKKLTEVIGAGPVMRYRSLILKRAGLVEVTFFNPEDAVKTLASGLIGMAPPPFNLGGTVLLALVYPKVKKMQTDWDEVFDKVGRIVDNKIAEERVSRAGQKIASVVDAINTMYLPVKASTKDMALLRSLLLPQESSLQTDVMTALMNTSPGEMSFAATTLSNFTFAALIHLAVLQELALIDPDAQDPKTSVFATRAAAKAKAYAAYLRTTAPKMLPLRLEQVSGVKTKNKVTCHATEGPIPNCMAEFKYWFEDRHPKSGLTNGRSETYTSSVVYQRKFGDGDVRVKQAHAQHKKNVTAAMKSWVEGNILDVAGKLEKLGSNPVPLEKLKS